MAGRTMSFERARRRLGAKKAKGKESVGDAEAIFPLPGAQEAPERHGSSVGPKVPRCMPANFGVPTAGKAELTSGARATTRSAWIQQAAPLGDPREPSRVARRSWVAHAASSRPFAEARIVLESP